MIPQLAAPQPGNVSPARSHHPHCNAGSSFAESLVAAGRDLATQQDQTAEQPNTTEGGATEPPVVAQPPVDPVLLRPEPITAQVTGALAAGHLAVTAPLSSDQEANQGQPPLAAETESEGGPQVLPGRPGQGWPELDATATATTATEQVATTSTVDAEVAFANLTTGTTGHSPVVASQPNHGADQVGNQPTTSGRSTGHVSLDQPEAATGPAPQGQVPSINAAQPGQEPVAVPAVDPAGGLTPVRHSGPIVQINPAGPVPPLLVDQVRGPLGQLRNAPEGNHVFSIRITPENLGPVQVRAHIGADHIRVELIGATDAVRDQLRTMLTDLRRDLQSTGMTAQMSVSDSDSTAQDRTAGHGFKDQPGRNHNPTAARTGPSGTAANISQAGSGTAQPHNRAASGVDILA